MIRIKVNNNNFEQKVSQVKYKHLIYLSLSLFCVGCQKETQNQSSIALKDTKSLPQQALYQDLSRDDLLVLKRVSYKTLDKIQKKQMLDYTDVVFMQYSGINQDSIIQILIYTNSKFNLTTPEIIKLQNAGVSFKVINFMARMDEVHETSPVKIETPKTFVAVQKPSQAPVTSQNIDNENMSIYEADKAVKEKESRNYTVTIGPIVEQVRMTGSQYAYTKNGNATTYTAMPGSGKTLQPSFDLDWGITAGLSYYFDEKKWALNTRFDWLSSTGKTTDKVNGTNNIVPINIWRDQFIADLVADLGVAGYGKSHFQVDYYNLNIDLDRVVFSDKSFRLEPHMGLKLSFIYDTVTSTFTGDGSDTSLDPDTRLGDNILTREQKTNFWGIGPSVGLNSDWIVRGGCSFFFEGTGAILIGNASAKDLVTYTAYGNSTTNTSSPNMPTLSPTLQALLGLKYEKTFFNDSQKLTIKLGWDNSFYWNQWNHVNTVSESTYSSSMDTFQLSEGNTFGLTGILFNVNWNF